MHQRGRCSLRFRPGSKAQHAQAHSAAIRCQEALWPANRTTLCGNPSTCRHPVDGADEATCIPEPTSSQPVEMMSFALACPTRWMSGKPTPWSVCNPLLLRDLKRPRREGSRCRPEHTGGHRGRSGRRSRRNGSARRALQTPSLRLPRSGHTRRFEPVGPAVKQQEKGRHFEARFEHSYIRL